MPTFRILNAPQELSMTKFRAVSDRYGGLLKSARFAVQIRPVGNKVIDLQSWKQITSDFTYLCEIAEIPGRGFMNLDLRYYGPNFKIPYQSSYEDTTLTFLCRTESIERQFFDDWMNVINPINVFDFSYRDEYHSEIDIFQFSDASETEEDKFPKAVYFVTLHNAYPLLVNPQPMTWGDNQFTRLAVSFTYTKWSRKGHDVQPGYTRDELVIGKTNEGIRRTTIGRAPG